METNYKKFRKVPPYMTKAGIQIGLLYQEPFEPRMDKDGFALQRALLKQKHNVNEPYVTIDGVIVAVCVVLLIAFIVGAFYGFI